MSSPSAAIDREAEAILALPPLEARARLNIVLGRAADYAHESRARDAALDFNAHLCTRIREIGEQRSIRTPWYKP